MDGGHRNNSLLSTGIIVSFSLSCRSAPETVRPVPAPPRLAPPARRWRPLPPPPHRAAPAGCAPRPATRRTTVAAAEPRPPSPPPRAVALHARDVNERQVRWWRVLQGVMASSAHSARRTVVCRGVHGEGGEPLARGLERIPERACQGVVLCEPTPMSLHVLRLCQHDLPRREAHLGNGRPRKVSGRRWNEVEGH